MYVNSYTVSAVFWTWTDLYSVRLWKSIPPKYYTVEPLLNGQTLLGGQYSKSRWRFYCFCGHFSFPEGWPLNRGWSVLSSSPKRTRLSLLFKTRIRFPNQLLPSTLCSFTLQSKIASANIEEFLCNWSFSLVGFVPLFCDKVNSKCWFWHDYLDAGTDHRICYGSPLVQNLIAHSVNNCDYALLCAIFLSFLVTYTGSVQYSVNRG